MAAKVDVQRKLEGVQEEYTRRFNAHVKNGGSKNDVLSWNRIKIYTAICGYLKNNYETIFMQSHFPCPKERYGEFNIPEDSKEEFLLPMPSMKKLCDFYAITQFKKKLYADNGELSKAELANVARFCKSFNMVYIVSDSFEKAVMAFIADSASTGDIGEMLYYKLAESAKCNSFMRSLSIKITDPAQLDVYGNALIEGKGNDTRLFVEGYSVLARKPQQSAAMLVDAFMIKATESGMTDTLMRLPLKEYMSMRGLSDEKSARSQADLDLEALKRITFMYKQKTGKRKGDWLEVRLSGGTTGQVRGELIFRFNQEFYDSFKATGATGRTQFMYFPREALQGSIHANPWKYWLGRKVSELKRINLGKPNEDIIGVKSLLGACPNYPTHEEVMSGGAHVQQLIIDPFERDMDTFTTFRWNYTGEQPHDYNSFIESYVQIIWRDYPDTSKLVENREKHAKQAAKTTTAKRGRKTKGS